jgi:transposase
VYSKGASEQIIGRWLAGHPTEAHRARRIPLPSRRRAHRPLPNARLGCAHPDRGDTALPG